MNRNVKSIFYYSEDEKRQIFLRYNPDTSNVFPQNTDHPQSAQQYSQPEYTTQSSVYQQQPAIQYDQQEYSTHSSSYQQQTVLQYNQTDYYTGELNRQGINTQVKAVRPKNKKIIVIMIIVTGFLVLAGVVTALAVIGSSETNNNNNDMIQPDYNELLSKADIAIENYKRDNMNYDMRNKYRKCIKEAIEYDDTRVEAFERLLDLYNEKESLCGIELSYISNRSEYQEFVSITGQYFTEDNAEKYYNETFADRIFLRIGINLFLNSDNEIEGRKDSLNWLKLAKEYCSDKNKAKATTMYELSSFYNEANIDNIIDLTGDFNYAQYWNILIKFEEIVHIEKNDNENKNIVFIVGSCSFIAREILNYSSLFESSDVSKADMITMLDNLSADIENTEKYMNNTDQVKKTHDAKTSIELARNIVNAL